MSQVLVISLLASLPLAAYGQYTSATCASSLSWLDNSLEQNPCEMASALLGTCTDEQPFNLTALGSNDFAYAGPTTTDSADWTYNDCLCSMPLYNLLMACQLCQDRNPVTWAAWTGNCNASYTGSAGYPVYDFPLTVPSDTLLPAWTYMNSSNEANGEWSEAATNQNITGVASTTTSSTTTSASASSTSSSSSGGSSSNAGAIAGGVVGGIALLAIAGLAFYYMRRRHSRRRDASHSIIPMAQNSNYNSSTSKVGYSDQPYLPPPSTSPAYEQSSNDHYPNPPNGSYVSGAGLESRLTSPNDGNFRGATVRGLPEIQSEDDNAPDRYPSFRA